MANVKFNVPTNLEELSKVTNDPNRYIVSQEYTLREVSDYLDGISEKVKENGYEFILDDFDLIYSALRNFRNLTSSQQTALWKGLLRSLNLFNDDLSQELQKARTPLLSDNREKLRWCNMLKMLVFSVCTLIESNEAVINKKWAEDNRATDARKSAKKKNAQGVGIANYEKERERAITLLYKLLVLPIQIIFNPPVVEEEFTNCITRCCWKLIEDQTIHRNNTVVEDVFHIIGYIIEKHSGSLGFCLKIIQLLQHKEALDSPLAKMVEFIVKQHNQSLLISEIIREIERIDVKELSRDSSGPRAIANFLDMVAEKCPREMRNSLGNMLPFLEQDSYSMRSATLSIIGTVISNCLSDEKMTPLEKQNRDKLLDKLQLHMMDITSYTRARALGTWSKLCKERKIPINRYEKLIEDVVERLQDKSSYGRKAALNFLTTFLRANIFGIELKHKAVVNALEKGLKKFEELNEAKKRLEEKGQELAKFNPLTLWEPLEPEFRKFLAEKLVELESEDAAEVMDTSSELEDLYYKLILNLNENNFMDAYSIYKLIAAEENLQENQSSSQKKSNEKEDDNDSNNVEDESNHSEESAAASIEKIIVLCRKIYLENASADDPDETIRYDFGSNKDEIDLANVDLEGVVQAINRQENILKYLTNILKIIEHLRAALPTICDLLHSKNISDVQGAISFIVTAYEFGMKEEAEIGLRKMISLIFAGDSTKKEVITAYRSILIESSAGSKPKTIVKKLIDLLRNATQDEVLSLEELLKEFWKAKDFDKPFINLLWEMYALKSPDTTEEESRYAIQLISMLASAECAISRRNLDTLCEIGLGERGLKDMHLVKYTCVTLARAMKYQGSIITTELPYRFAKTHTMFEKITKIIVDTFDNKNSHGWLSMQDAAMQAVYNLAEHPEQISEKIIYGMIEKMLNQKTENDPVKEFERHLDELPPTQTSGPLFTSSQIITSTQNPGEESIASEATITENTSPSLSNTIISPQESPFNTQNLTRFITFLGTVAINLLVHLEVNIYTELKTRSALKEESVKRKSLSLTRVSMRRKSGRQSLVSNANDEEELGLTGVVTADDAEAEFISGLCEEMINRTRMSENLLSRMAKLVVMIATDPAKFSDDRLRAATSLTLGKMMLISEKFCSDHLRLLFTILTKSKEAAVLCNTIIGAGDLCVRFPNLLEPWTHHLYEHLSNNDILVRTYTLKVLARLIHSDMIKVQERISEIAKLMCDEDPDISSFAKWFFLELNKKQNAVYNVLPDIISRLSSIEVGVDQNTFRVIMKFLLGLVDKERHYLGLLEKLCQRLKGNTNERQWCDYAFCLSLLKYGDKSISKLFENFACYADKVSIPEVYDLFNSIISSTSKQGGLKNETKALLDEFQTKLNHAKNKGVEDEVTSANTSGSIEEDKGEAMECDESDPE